MVKADILIYLLDECYKIKPTFNKIFRGLTNVHSSVFIRKKIGIFENKGLITIGRNGRCCIIELTEKGTEVARLCRKLKEYEVL